MRLSEEARRISEDFGAEPAERRWIQAAMGGDLSAMDALMALHWNRVASVVRRYCRDPNKDARPAGRRE